ncbi:MAG: hypothetical protein Tsb0021_12600 [Chlamydiales bacterium]
MALKEELSETRAGFNLKKRGLLMRNKWPLTFSFACIILMLILFSGYPHEWFIRYSLRYASRSENGIVIHYQSIKHDYRLIEIHGLHIEEKGSQFYFPYVQFFYHPLSTEISFCANEGALIIGNETIHCCAQGKFSKKIKGTMSLDTCRDFVDIQPFKDNFSFLLPLSEGRVRGIVNLDFSEEGIHAITGSMDGKGFCIDTSYGSLEFSPFHCCNLEDGSWGLASPASVAFRFPYQLGPLQQSFTEQEITIDLKMLVTKEGFDFYGLAGNFPFGFRLQQQEIQNAWFHVENFDLKQLYLTENMSIMGLCDIEFFQLSENTYNFTCLLNDLILKTSSFELSIPKAYTVNDIAHWKLFNGSLKEHHHQIEIHETNGEVSFSEEGLKIAPLDGTFQSIPFLGELSVSLNSDHLWEIALHFDSILSPLSELNKAIFPLCSFPTLTHLPIEGTVSLREKGCEMKWLMDSRMQQRVGSIDFDISANLSDGRYDSNLFDLSLKDFRLDIDYHLKDNKISLGNLHGVVFIGPQDFIEEYTLTGKHISLEFGSVNKGTFDLWLGNHYRDIMRLTGTMGLSDTSIICHLDPNCSHLGAARTKNFSCELQNRTFLDKMQLDMELNCCDFLPDLKTFSKLFSKILPLKLQEFIQNSHSANGVLNVQLDYCDQAFNLCLDSDEIQVNGGKVHSLFLKSHLYPENWILDRLQIDDFLCFADLHKNHDDLGINIREITYKNILKTSGKGNYFFDSHKICMKLDAFALDIAKINEIPHLQRFTTNYLPSEKIKGEGDLTFYFDHGQEEWQCDVKLFPTFENLSIKKLPLVESDPINLVVNQKGITLRSSNFYLKNPFNEELLKIGIENCGYNFSGNHFWINTHQIHIPKNILLPILSYLSQDSSDVLKILLNYIPPQPLIGHGSLILKPHHFTCQVELNDLILQKDAYFLVLKQLECQKIKDSFQFSGNISLCKEIIPFSLSVENTTDKRFSLTFLDHVSPFPLTVKGNLDKHHVLFDSIQGGYQGIFMDLAAQDQSSLNGRVIIPTKSFLKQCKEGQTVSLEGKWNNFFIKSKELPVFTGNFSAENVSYGKWNIEHLKGDCKADIDHVELHDVNMYTSLGSIFSPEGFLSRGTGSERWDFYFPSLAFQGRKDRSYGIKKGEFSHFKGTLFDSKSYYAQGKVVLGKCSPHILSSLSLKLPVPLQPLSIGSIQPVSGSVYFELKDDRIFFTQIKDVYSDKRMIKYLLSKDNASYFQKDGSLHLVLTLQPLQSILKAKHMPQIYISGNWKHPKISLQNPWESKGQEEKGIATSD